MKADFSWSVEEATFTPRSLVESNQSMPRRLLEVIEKAGTVTKYQAKDQFTQSAHFRDTSVSIKIYLIFFRRAAKFYERDCNVMYSTVDSQSTVTSIVFSLGFDLLYYYRTQPLRTVVEFGRLVNCFPNSCFRENNIIIGIREDNFNNN